MTTFPSVEWIQNSTSVDPSGLRHLKTTGFVKTLGTGATGQLDYGSIDVTTSGAISDTRLVFARMISAGDASGIFNMKFFLNNISAWTAGRYRFLFQKNLHFLPSNELDESNEDLPVVVPASPNLLSTVRVTAPTGGNNVSGVLDEDVTQYIWLATLAGNDVPVGQYGGAGAGVFRYRLIFDFS